MKDERGHNESRPKLPVEAKECFIVSICFYAACLGKKSESRVHTDTRSSEFFVIVTSITRTCCECHEDAVARWANKAGSQGEVLESS